MTACIDGKRIRTASKMSDNPIHIVSAWVAENQLTLAQTMVSDKSNEITALPQLIETLDLKGATVTIDAMGCQTEIAKKIRKASADYILGVKDNQVVRVETRQIVKKTGAESSDTRYFITSHKLDCAEKVVECKQQLYYSFTHCSQPFIKFVR